MQKQLHWHLARPLCVCINCTRIGKVKLGKLNRLRVEMLFPVSEECVAVKNMNNYHCSTLVLQGLNGACKQIKSSYKSSESNCCKKNRTKSSAEPGKAPNATMMCKLTATIGCPFEDNESHYDPQLGAAVLTVGGTGSNRKTDSQRNIIIKKRYNNTDEISV
ncbi:hypothetical protein KIN20_006225 [Parelaphostrongylus tenuis]|uniref:Uncharacterized protein n=1 Tax=Parelaphostrongylus tenuis TaxID=148309 RepID=A0AAD5MK11_PARTN|nr:hypothetical protein KIN20_006225 [Parelaphostrongylus tenuis]